MTMNYRNAKFCRNGTTITCEIEHPVHGWIPFSCDPADTGADIDVQELHRRMVSSGQVTAMTEAEIKAYDAAEARMERDALLRSVVDPLVTNPLRWADLDDELQQQWTAYRRALLDLPQQEGFPTEIDWPVAPGAKSS
jgi:hypothetical protein